MFLIRAAWPFLRLALNSGSLPGGPRLPSAAQCVPPDAIAPSNTEIKSQNDAAAQYRVNYADQADQAADHLVIISVSCFVIWAVAFVLCRQCQRARAARLLQEQAEIDNALCVICMVEPKSVSLVHSNETSHRCVCAECSDRLKATGAACPVCRLPIICHLKNQFES